MADKPWALLVQPIVRKCRLAVSFNVNASFNSEGATALADLLEKMAQTIDDEIETRERAE